MGREKDGSAERSAEAALPEPINSTSFGVFGSNFSFLFRSFFFENLTKFGSLRS